MLLRMEPGLRPQPLFLRQGLKLTVLLPPKCCDYRYALPSLAIISILTQALCRKKKKVNLHTWMINTHHSCLPNIIFVMQKFSVDQYREHYLFAGNFQANWGISLILFPLFLERTGSRVRLDEILLMYFQEWIQLRDGSFWYFHQVNALFQ